MPRDLPTVAADFPIASAISPYDISKASRSTNTARSVGPSVCSTVSIAIDTLSASSTSSRISGLVKPCDVIPCAVLLPTAMSVTDQSAREGLGLQSPARSFGHPSLIMRHVKLTTLQAGLAEVRRSPVDGGHVELIVRRPAEERREVLVEAELSIHAGLIGDRWSVAKDGRAPNPEAQLTLMNARAAALIAGCSDHGGLAGDQLYVDFDLSTGNIPPGTQLAIGSAMIEVTAEPHTGCGKFARRFGVDALKFVNSKDGRPLGLRGINTKVIVAGIVRQGDVITTI
jgi:hypothetical protein